MIGPPARRPAGPPAQEAARGGRRGAQGQGGTESDDGMAVWLLAMGLLLGATTASDYTGAEVCRACHARIWERWRQSPHAQAQQRLDPAARADHRCLGCHATGSGADLQGVQCEACHGPGRLYAAPQIMRSGKQARELGLVAPSEAVCRRCHTPDTPALRAWDFQARLPLVNHGEKW
ncbi:MAG: hypothetical protein FJ125_17885 [Deltaproteobacteria bacterium]|nr:hypothetical protein [Deltaproteobacteria bacterium]